MFLKNTNNLTYMAVGSSIPTTYNGLAYSTSVRQQNKDMPGVCLAAQYIESYKLQTGKLCQIQAGQLNAVCEKAYQLDVAAGYFDYTSQKYPSLNNVMQAFISLGYVTNTSGIGYIQPQIDDIKYFIYTYGRIIIEMTLTDQTYNAYDYLIDTPGTVMNEIFTKGFIAFGYDENYIYLQNSLGLSAGSLGFNKMTWNTAINLAVKGTTLIFS